MPCNGDYLAPTERETASQQFCWHLCYLLGALKREIPDWARKGADEYYGDPARVNDATVLLCETIRGLTEDEKERLLYDGRNPQARSLADFWERHEAADKRRQQEAQVRDERERLNDEAEFERLRRKLNR